MSDNRTSVDAFGSAFGTASNPEQTNSPRADSGSSAAGTLPSTPRAGRRRSDRIVLASARSQQAVDQAGVLARTDAPLLILGPDGSGRQHYARAIHQWSARAGGPLVITSCSETPETLQSRDLFGVSTEADPLSSGGTPGALARAAGGTLVIERADLLAASVRERLVRTLRADSSEAPAQETRRPDARVIATAASEAETLLGDAPVQVLRLAPLTERCEDILPLAAHFLTEFADEEGLTAVGFTVDARRWLVAETWRGNVRELRERIRQAVRLCDSGSVSAEALMLSSEGDEVPSFKEAKRAFETRYVEGLLQRCSGNISRAARLAKKDRKDFYDVIRRTGVDPTRFRSRA